MARDDTGGGAPSQWRQQQAKTPAWQRSLLQQAAASPLPWHLQRVRTADAWAVTRGQRAIIVAVLDTGIDASHPALAGSLWTNAGEVPGNGADDDGNGEAAGCLGAAGCQAAAQHHFLFPAAALKHPVCAACPTL